MDEFERQVLASNATMLASNAAMVAEMKEVRKDLCELKKLTTTRLNAHSERIDSLESTRDKQFGAAKIIGGSGVGVALIGVIKAVWDRLP